MKVCVIGAGPSGLTTIKQLLDEKHEVTCFEKNDGIGGIWYRNDIDDVDQMKVYDHLILTISMKLMSFSDFMIEPERVFYDHGRYLEYLRAYATKFGLLDCIRLKSTVSEISKNPSGTWSVTAVSNGVASKDEFDAVAICSGPFQKPNLDVADIDKFTGEVVHSSHYRSSERFREKKFSWLDWPSPAPTCFVRSPT
jgi:cation diffusion facilitator CzcD-associated flavoprotein CzcO